ncbi:MAG: hypothetical protein EOM51_10380, partial [Clostridia bacterium]|nr:hypothetical protein [Clostridia bacterium]
MFGKNLKRTLIISGCYLLLLVTLLVGLTLARYQDAKIAYTSFGTANFNALILGENTIEAMTAEEPTVNAFGVNLQTINYRPGMVWNENPNLNTAEILPFSVANGKSSSDCSQVSVDYTLRLRTTGSLPFRYTLAFWIADATEEGGGHDVYYTTGEPKTVTDGSADAGTWYEYAFYPTGEASAEEAVFSLSGGSLQLNSHRLIVEWPVEDGGENGTDTNSPAYMKEVEMIEILAAVSSKNMLDVDGYLDTEIPDTGLVYSTGIIIIDPAKGTTISENTQDFTYDIDYRSFSQDGTSSRSFTFTVDNGIGRDTEQSSPYIVYDMLLKIPVNAFTRGYNYTLYTGSSAVGTALSTPMQYRLYNELDGTYIVCPTTIYPEGKSEPNYRMYAIYSLASDKTLVNRINNPSGGGQISFADADTYKLSITKPNLSQITTSELENICFDNKLNVLVEAEFTDA